jgi:hypothetical protein
MVSDGLVAGLDQDLVYGDAVGLGERVDDRRGNGMVLLRVEPRGFEALTSAVQRRHLPKLLRSYHTEEQTYVL